MFFIGIFRIYPEEKKVAETMIDHIPEHPMGIKAELFRQNQVFDFFFIPVFRYHKKYYLLIPGTHRIFLLNNEKAEDIIRRGGTVSYYDVEEVQVEDYHCPSCGSRIEGDFKYCPFCGKDL